MKYVAKYKESKYPRRYEKDPNKKDKDYFRSVCESIYSLFVANRTGISYSDQSEYEELRDYGNGTQSVLRYKNYFSGEAEGSTVYTSPPSDIDGEGGWTQTPTDKRKGYMNVLWEVISPATKIRSSLLGKFQNAEYDVVANAIDAFSGAEEETKKYKLWMYKENLQFYQQYYQKAGITPESQPFMPENPDEIDLYQEMGGFKPEYAKTMELLNAYTLDISEWDGIKDLMMVDAIDLSVFACREYFDWQDNKFKLKYVDPANLVIQYSKYLDHRDSEFAGEFADYTVSTIRPMLLEAGYTEEDIEKIAKDYCSYAGNPDIDQWTTYSRVENLSEHGYDFFKVNVFECEFVETDSKQKLYHKNEQGVTKVIEQDLGTKNKENKNNNVKVTDYKYKYKCSWVVGSDYVFDFGKCTDILRPNKKDVALSYHVYKLPTKSITQQLRPLYDNFAILWFKYQNMIAMAANSGYVINYDSISNMTIGGGKFDEAQIIKRFLETGILIFKETNAMTTRNTAIKPVQELEGGMGRQFIEIRDAFLFNIGMIENLTGISPLTLGSVDPNAPVKTSEIGVATTNDTLRPIIMGYLKIKERVASNVVLWIQMKIKHDPDVMKGYREVIGDDDIETLKTAEKNNVEYGISLIARPTDADKQDILESAKISLQNGRDGKPGITEADYFQIRHILSSNGSYKLAEIVLADRIRKSMKEADQRAKENLAIQQQGVLAQEQAKLQAELATIKANEDKEINVELAKALIQIAITDPANTEMQMKLAGFTEMIKSTLQPQQNSQMAS